MHQRKALISPFWIRSSAGILFLPVLCAVLTLCPAIPSNDTVLAPFSDVASEGLGVVVVVAGAFKAGAGAGAGAGAFLARSMV